MEINTIEDILNLLGSEKPFDFKNNKAMHSDCLTESGNVAYDNLRNILFYLQDENIITNFNEDELDKYIDLNY